ncbi:MAG TPA: metallophosphoesterase, partial [Candidatus Hydrogenedentes bacterium]|nr:metallophosphoesterase [Candidatus Hydrogenedentota bacterium]
MRGWGLLPGDPRRAIEIEGAHESGRLYVKALYWPSVAARAATPTTMSIKSGVPTMSSFCLRVSVRICVLGVLLAAVTGCPRPFAFRYLNDPTIESLISQAPPVYPPTRFAVASDIHLYDADLGIEGAAFEDYLAHDRKMLAESEEILAAMLEDIVADAPEFLVVCGDLTKDGEAVNHALAAQYLAGVEAEGIPVFVVPGNHDLNNPHAMSFD